MFALWSLIYLDILKELITHAYTIFCSKALTHFKTKNTLLTFAIRLHYEWQMLETKVKIIISCIYWLNSCNTQSLRKIKHV